ALEVIDHAMQTHGAMGVSQDTPLARMYAWIRALRFADGPDEVHRQSIARRELRRWAWPRTENRQPRSAPATGVPRERQVFLRNAGSPHRTGVPTVGGLSRQDPGGGSSVP